MNKFRVGVFLLVAFITLSSMRDVVFAMLFRNYAISIVATFSFGAGTILFVLINIACRHSLLESIRKYAYDILVLNILTAMAWYCYLYALKYIEPSIVNAIWASICPLYVYLYGRKFENHTQSQRYLYLYLLVIFWLVFIVLLGKTGFETVSFQDKFKGLVLITVSAASISQATIIGKRLTDQGVEPSVIMSTRFLLVTIIFFVHSHSVGELDKVVGSIDIVSLFIGLGLVFIVLPNYLFQKSLQFINSLTAEIFNACAPAIIFIIQLFDEVIKTSMYTGISLTSYVFVALLVAFLHSRKSIKS